MTAQSAATSKRDRVVLNVVLAHVPVTGVVGALFGHLVVGLAIAGAAALLCAAAYACARETRLFRVAAGVVLMFDSAALIAASGGVTAMHFHVFIVMADLRVHVTGNMPKQKQADRAQQRSWDRQQDDERISEIFVQRRKNEIDDDKRHREDQDCRRAGLRLIE